VLAAIIGLENADYKAKENNLVLVQRNALEEQNFIVVLAEISAILTSKQELDTPICRVLERLNMHTGMTELLFACPSPITPMNALL
jgi:hypothetical protein